MMCMAIQHAHAPPHPPPWTQLLLCGFHLTHAQSQVVEAYAGLPPTFSEALDGGGLDCRWGDTGVPCVCRQGGVWISLNMVYSPDRRRCLTLVVEAGHFVRRRTGDDASLSQALRGMLYALEHCVFRGAGGERAADVLVVRTHDLRVVECLAQLNRGWTVSAPGCVVRRVSPPAAAPTRR